MLCCARSLRQREAFHRPPQVEIHLIVEDCEERLLAEEIEQLITIVQELL